MKNGIRRDIDQFADRRVGVGRHGSTRSSLSRVKLELEALINELRWANAHLYFWKQLAEATQQYLEETNRAPGFWTFTMDAHKEACLLRLMRILDKDKQASSIPGFLNYVESNYKQLRELPLPDDQCYSEKFAGLRDSLPQMIVEHRNELNEHEIVLASLSAWRDKKYAHLDKDVLLGKIDLNSYKLPLGFVEKLIKKCHEILYWYGVAYLGTDYALEFSAAPILEQVFKPLRLGYAQLKAHIT